MKQLRIATRGSPLARWQASAVAAALRARHPGLRTSLVVVVSGGDSDQATPLYRMPAIGVFCKEVHQAVLNGRADIGVHSCKDLPTAAPAGIVLAACLRRADPRDCLVGASSIAALPHGAVVGTSSLRRREQLRLIRPDLRFTDLRGNVGTRLRKVADGEAAATVMALAGLSRLGCAWLAHASPLDPEVMVPAPAQGAVAIDCRSDDRHTLALLAAIDHGETRRAVGIERTILERLSGGCSLPFGCLARRTSDGWEVLARWCREGAVRDVRCTGPRPRVLADTIAALVAGLPELESRL